MNRMTAVTIGIGMAMMFSLAASINAVVAEENKKQPQIQTPAVSSAPYEVRMKVSRNGYFLENGTRPLEILELPRGLVELVLLYDEKGDPLEHQFTISNNVTGFYLQSELLSSARKTVRIRFKAGENDVKEYDIFCSISCEPGAMMQLFKKIKVVEKTKVIG